MTTKFNIQENELIAQYQKTSDQKVLGQLYVPYQNLVLGVCLKYFKNMTDAKDAQMSVYELISKKLKTHNVDNFKSWLYVVTKNFCLEKLRKRGKDLKKEKAAADVYSEQVFHLDNIDKEEALNKLERCMDGLILEQRQAIQSFYFEKKSYQEVAKMNGISWSKVRSNIQNGRRMLKNCMDA